MKSLTPYSRIPERAPPTPPLNLDLPLVPQESPGLQQGPGLLVLVCLGVGVGYTRGHKHLQGPEPRMTVQLGPFHFSTSSIAGCFA